MQLPERDEDDITELEGKIKCVPMHIVAMPQY